MIATAGCFQAEQVRQEAGRRLIVRLVFIVFLLLIFEGALRKWVLPDLQRPLYFSRDPIVWLIYMFVLLSGLILRSHMLVIVVLFAVPVTALHLILALSGTGHPIAWALGVRHYFFYVPLAFVIGCCFRFEDFAGLVRLNLVLALPIAALVYAQHLSPPAAFVNRALADSFDSVTYVADDVLRPYGTFSHTSGHVLYVAASLALIAVAWVMRREMRLPLWLLLPATGATLVMMLTTGSRAIWFFIASTALCLAAVGLSSGRARHALRALGFVVVVSLAAAALYATVLAPAYEAMVVRQEVAARSEGSIFLRALGSVTHAFDIVDQAPFAGAGLGAGILGAVAVTTGERYFALAETEWARIVLELGPVLGLGFIALRIALVTWLLWRALLANHLWGNPAGLLLFGFIGPHLLVGQVTMNGQSSVFAWFFVGLILAETNSARNQIQ